MGGQMYRYMHKQHEWHCDSLSCMAAKNLPFFCSIICFLQTSSLNQTQLRLIANWINIKLQSMVYLLSSNNFNSTAFQEVDKCNKDATKPLLSVNKKQRQRLIKFLFVFIRLNEASDVTVLFENSSTRTHNVFEKSCILQ